MTVRLCRLGSRGARCGRGRSGPKDVCEPGRFRRVIRVPAPRHRPGSGSANVVCLSRRTVRSGLRRARPLRGRHVQLRRRLVRSVLQYETVRRPVQRTRAVQERHLPVRDRLERQALHVGGLPEQLFGARTVPGEWRQRVAVQVRGRLGRAGLQHSAGTGLQRQRGQRQRSVPNPHPNYRRIRISVRYLPPFPPPPHTIRLYATGVFFGPTDSLLVELFNAIFLFQTFGTRRFPSPGHGGR